MARHTRALRRFLDATTRRFVFYCCCSSRAGRRRAPRRRWSPTLRRVDSLPYGEIERRRGDPRAPEREDILSLVLQARDNRGLPMTDVQVRDELMTLFVAGHETTATPLAWAVERLARHGGAFDRPAAEAASGGAESLDAVVKETCA